MINLASVCGSLLWIEARRSEVVDVAGSGKDNVGGSPNPGNVVTKTLRFLVAMVSQDLLGGVFETVKVGYDGCVVGWAVGT